MADVNIDIESTDGQQLFNQGVKAFILRDYKNAVDALVRATEIKVTELGDDLHDSLGETYLYYGKALLSLYRQESDPIGNLPKQLENSASGEEEEEDEEAENEENEEKVEGGNDDVTKEEAEGNKNGDESKEAGDEKEEDDEDCLKVDETDKTGVANPNESFLELDPVEPEPEEEPTDLQLAWESLELAKKIFEKRGDEGKKSYAETLTTLGEISLESENYAAAINDFEEAIEIQKTLYSGDSRKLAQTYYHLGISHASNTSYKEGIANLKKSIDHLEKRIRILEDKKEEPEEVQEMKDLIPEIYEKIKDFQSLTDEVCCDNCKCIDELTVSFQKAKVREVLKKTCENLKLNSTSNSNAEKPAQCLHEN